MGRSGNQISVYIKRSTPLHRGSLDDMYSAGSLHFHLFAVIFPDFRDCIYYHDHGLVAVSEHVLEFGICDSFESFGRNLRQSLCADNLFAKARNDNTATTHHCQYKPPGVWGLLTYLKQPMECHVGISSQALSLLLKLHVLFTR